MWGALIRLLLGSRYLPRGPFLAEDARTPHIDPDEHRRADQRRQAQERALERYRAEVDLLARRDRKSVV